MENVYVTMVHMKLAINAEHAPKAPPTTIFQKIAIQQSHVNKTKWLWMEFALVLGQK